MNRSILYYPTIDLPEGNWVKNTLMYWDKICTIVPYKGYMGNCTDDIRKLREMELYGAIIGKAYYTGAINLKEAVELAK